MYGSEGVRSSRWQDAEASRGSQAAQTRLTAGIAVFSTRKSLISKRCQCLLTAPCVHGQLILDGIHADQQCNRPDPMERDVRFVPRSTAKRRCAMRAPRSARCTTQFQSYSVILLGARSAACVRFMSTCRPLRNRMPAQLADTMRTLTQVLSSNIIK